MEEFYSPPWMVETLQKKWIKHLSTGAEPETKDFFYGFFILMVNLPEGSG